MPVLESDLKSPVGVVLAIGRSSLCCAVRATDDFKSCANGTFYLNALFLLPTAQSPDDTISCVVKWFGTVLS